MVREVESLEPELDRVLFRDSEVLVGGEIPLDDARRDDRVPAGGAEGSEGLKREGAGVEPAIDRPLAARKDRGLSCSVHTIKADVRVRLIEAGGDGLRKAALQRENRPQFPASDDCIGNAALVKKPPSPADRQLIEHGSRSPMIDIETR